MKSWKNCDFLSVLYQLRINSSFFYRLENVLTYTVAIEKRESVIIVTTIVDWIDSGPQRYEHWNGPLCYVKVSRHLNVNWGQQIASLGLIHLIHCKQHAIGCLVRVRVIKMENTDAKYCFLKLRLFVLTKNDLPFCYNWVTYSWFFWPLRNPPATQQTFKSYFAYTLLLKNFLRARWKEF